MSIPRKILEIVEPIRMCVTAIARRDKHTLASIVPNWQEYGPTVMEHMRAYPRRIVQHPDEAFLAIDFRSKEGDYVNLPEGWKFPVIYIYEIEPDRWDIDVFLWTDQGLADVAASLVVIDYSAGKRISEFHDIGVH